MRVCLACGARDLTLEIFAIFGELSFSRCDTHAILNHKKARQPAARHVLHGNEVAFVRKEIKAHLAPTPMNIICPCMYTHMLFFIYDFLCHFRNVFAPEANAEMYATHCCVFHLGNWLKMEKILSLSFPFTVELHFIFNVIN